MKKLQPISNRGFFIISRSPEQYNDKIRTAENIREMNEFGSGFVIFGCYASFHPRSN